MSPGAPFSAPTDAAEAAPAERVSAGRAAFLERKRAQTRAAILAAARTVFADTPYVHATIDDILRTAAVSRATFYQHFDSKLSLAGAIYAAMRPEVLALFERLAGIDGRDRATVLAWLRDYVALYRAHRYVVPLLAQLQIFEPAFRDQIQDDREGFAARLAPGADPEPRMRARLVLDSATAVCAEIAQSSRLSADETTAYFNAAAEQLATYLASRWTSSHTDSMV